MKLSNAKKFCSPVLQLILFNLSLLIASSVCIARAFSDYGALIEKGKSQLQAGNAAVALSLGGEAAQANANRWEAYALEGGALMNLKRYEEATGALSKAVERAPESKQSTLRDLRRQCLLAEAGSSATASSPPLATATSQAEIVLWKSIENSTKRSDFRAYLEGYPNGAFAVLARHHIADCENGTMNSFDELKEFYGTCLNHGHDLEVITRGMQAMRELRSSLKTTPACILNTSGSVLDGDIVRAQFNVVERCGTNGRVKWWYEHRFAQIQSIAVEGDAIRAEDANGNAVLLNGSNGSVR